MFQLCHEVRRACAHTRAHTHTSVKNAEVTKRCQLSLALADTLGTAFFSLSLATSRCLKMRMYKLKYKWTNFFEVGI